MLMGSMIVYSTIEQLKVDQATLRDIVESALLGLLILLIGVMCIASLWSEAIAGFLTKGFMGGGHILNRETSLYSKAESLIENGDIEAAIDAYKAIALKDFKNATPYIRMTELAFVTLKDPARAHALYIRGLALISNTDQRRKLENAYADLTVLSTMGTQQKGGLQ